MATVVIHKNTGKHYILVGTSYSYFKETSPSFFGGNLFPNEEEGEFELAAVCDENGVIRWFPTRDLTIIQIDSTSPKEILKNYMNENENADESNNNDYEECPGCGEKVKCSDRECPNCGLTLVSEDTEQ